MPRQINKLCDRSLEVGFNAQSPTVDEVLAAEAAVTVPSGSGVEAGRDAADRNG